VTVGPALTYGRWTIADSLASHDVRRTATVWRLRCAAFATIVAATGVRVLSVAPADADDWVAP
jgi:hypothetical protein